MTLLVAPAQIVPLPLTFPVIAGQSDSTGVQPEAATVRCRLNAPVLNAPLVNAVTTTVKLPGPSVRLNPDTWALAPHAPKPLDASPKSSFPATTLLHGL